MSIKLTSDSEKILQKLAKAGKMDLRPTFLSLSESYRKEVDLIFSHQQPRNEGLRWPALSERYKAQKDKDFPGTPILVRTGSLFASMTQKGAPGNITAIGKTSAIFGSTIAYGIYHDSDRPRKSNLPRRNFSEPSDRRRLIWIEMLTKDIRHNFEKEGIRITGEIAK